MKRIFFKFLIAMLLVLTAVTLFSCSNEHEHTLIKTEAIDPTCNTEGNVEYWTCKSCNKKFLDEKATNEATKPSDTVLEMTDCSYRGCVCIYCGAGEHSLKHYMSIEPSCSVNGRAEHWMCLICELCYSDSDAKNEIEDVVIPAGHVGGYEIRDKTSPTEFAYGYTGNKYCLGCGELIEMGEPIDRLDHSHVINHVLPRPATCTVNGNVEYWECTVCTKKYLDAEMVILATDVTVKASHNLSRVAPKTSTCRERGNVEYYECAKCGNYYSDANATEKIQNKATVKLAYESCRYEENRCVWCNDLYTWCNPNLKVVNNEYIVVTGLDDYSGTDIVIEKSYGGLPVKEIADGAFSYNTDITSIKLPEGLNSIGENAFTCCSSLVSVTLPSTLLYVGDNAFEGCFKLVEVVNRSTLDINSSKTSYGKVAYYAKLVHKEASKMIHSGDFTFFQYGNSLYLLSYSGEDVVVKLPESYNGASYKIHSYAFAGRSDIVSITVPYKVTEISQNAFYGCSGIVEVINNSTLNITKGGTDNGGIATYAFDVHSEQSKIISDADLLFFENNGEYYLVSYCGKATTLTLPDNVNGSSYKIKNGAFANNTRIKTIYTGGATEIGDMAFYGCTSLTKAVLDVSVKSVGRAAFQGCSLLSEVLVRGKIAAVGNDVFYMCPRLKSDPFN